MGSVVQFGKVGKRTPKDVPPRLAEQETSKGIKGAAHVFIVGLIVGLPWGILMLAFWRACR